MTAEQRAGLSDAALAMTQPCIDELIKDISRRVQKAGAITDTAEYQLYRAQALGESKKAIEQAVSKQIGISEEVIASLFEYVADKSLSLDENGSLKRMTEAYTRMTQSKTRELLRDLWADTPEGKAQPLQTAYARAMDFAFRQVATGTLDLNTAIRRAVTPLAKRGLRTIEQKSGRSVGIEYACRRYIMDQLGQLDDEIQRADHDALGCDGWEISAHAACAPDHEPIQGRQYGDAEFEKLNNSLQRRIGHLNCGHTANPIILGVNAPQYTEAQLQKFKDDNERGVVYNGYRYTLYEAGQEQSRIENGIRLIKRQILADEETESPDLQKHQIKLRVVQAEYARFCKAVGLPTRSERLQVAGFGRSQSNRAVWAYKKAAPEQLRDVEIAGHKLYSVTDERIWAVPKPFFQGVSNKVNGLAQEYARGVLKKVQGLEVGTEAVVNFTKDGKCTGYYVGGQNSMKVKPPEIQVPYYSLHNHPSNGAWPVLLLAVLASIAAVIINYLVTHWGEIKQNFSQTLADLAQALNTAGENLQHIWDTLWLTIKLLGLQIWESITTGWSNFWKGIDLALRMAGAALQAAWSACWLIIKLAAMQIWEDITTAWSNFWKGLSLLLSMAGAALNAVWTAAWSALADTVSSIWDGITSVVRGAVNGIIRIINGMISAIVGGMNAVIGLLNGFSFDVPEFAQDALGTAKIGFNIDPITAPQIPYLAQGAVIPANHEFLAVLGDQTNGTNVEAPLETIQQALAEVLAEWGGQDITIRFAASGGLEQLVRLLMPYIDKEKVRRGARLVVGGN